MIASSKKSAQAVDQLSSSLWKNAVAAGCAALVLLASCAQSPPESPRRAATTNKSALIVPQQYIVVLKPQVEPTAQSGARDRISSSIGATIIHEYSIAIKGFAVRASESQVASILALPEVAYVEPDSVIFASAVQQNPPTGLNRIDQRKLPLDRTFEYSETGAGVHVYIIDTGIRATHVDFGGRVSGGFTAIADGNGTNDCNGHGTHVAGTVGGSTYGVAKQVVVVPVRVLDCSGSGTNSGVIAGIDWVIRNGARPAVANMSLGGGASPSLDTAVRNGIAAGITFSIAAGNSNDNACNYSPARVAEGLTVGNIDPSSDTRNGTSNFGPCVTLFAPGTSILSAGHQSDTATAYMTGTSMAAPHVAGAAALYLQYRPGATPQVVRNGILGAANSPTTPGWPGIADAGFGSPQIQLHWAASNDGSHWGDPHAVTVGGLRYDFQATGEFVALRDGGRLEIQARQRPVSTTTAIVDGYTGIRACVSITSAVAVRVGQNTITFQGRRIGDTHPLEIRVDGALTNLPVNQPIELSGGGTVLRQDGSFEIQTPDGAKVTLAHDWWPSQGTWYFSTSVSKTRATEGLLGTLAAGSWLPALPDGSSLGPMPAGVSERYTVLYNRFANAWRVDSVTSLFDYQAGESESSFAVPNWPPTENAACVTSLSPVATPLSPGVAAELCTFIENAEDRRNCIADVAATGEAGFARQYRKLR